MISKLFGFKPERHVVRMASAFVLAIAAIMFIQGIARAQPTFNVIVSVPDPAGPVAPPTFSLSSIQAGVTSLVITTVSSGSTDLVSPIPAGGSVPLPYAGATDSESYVIAGFAGAAKVGQRTITLYKDGRVGAGLPVVAAAPGGVANAGKKIKATPRKTTDDLTEDKLDIDIVTTAAWPAIGFVKVRNLANGEVHETVYSLVPGAATQTVQVKLRRGLNSMDITILDATKAPLDAFADKTDIKCFLPCGNSEPTARAVIGFEQIGASSAESKGSPFLDFFFDAPLTKKGNGLSLWSNIRLSSIPVQTLVGFGTLPGFSSFLTTDAAKTNELVQSFDFQIGLEKSLFGEGVFRNGFLPGKTAVYAIGAVGAINPLSSQKTAQIFKIPANNKTFKDQFGEALVKDAQGNNLYTDIAFVSPERSRFYRQYFGGLRFKTRFFDQEGLVRTDMFPSIVDITAGQNEAITGRLLGVILRANGSAPLPVKDGVLSIFGSAQLRMGKGKKDKTRDPLFLDPSDITKVKLSDATTFIVPFEKNPNAISNRDTFRIGIGVDLFKIFKDSKTP